MRRYHVRLMVSVLVSLGAVAWTGHGGRVVMAQAAAEMVAQTDDRKAEGDRLFNQGNQQFQVSRFREALRAWGQALEIYREIGDRAREGVVLGNLGIAYSSLDQYQQAINFYERGLAINKSIQQQIEDTRPFCWNEASMPTNRELTRNYEKGALPLRRAAIRNEIDILQEAGWLFSYRAQYDDALACLERVLSLYQLVDDPSGEGQTLFNIAWVYYSTANYQKSINTYQQALEIQSAIQDRGLWGESYSLGGLGLVYYALGDYHQAIRYAEQALEIAIAANDEQVEGYSLVDLGDYYHALGQYEQALDFYQQAIDFGVIPHYQPYPYIGAGNTYYALQNYERAFDFYQQAVELAIGNNHPTVYALLGLGQTYEALGDQTQAIDYFQQAIHTARELGIRRGEGIALSKLGHLVVAQGQPELAIVFLKASVEVREAIRNDLQGLERKLQQSFVQTIANDYRLLADLLLEQGRIPEAQQVLDLLKLEELREFTDTTRAVWNGEELQYTNLEQPVIDAHGSLIALGGAILTCEDTDCPDLDNLYDQRDALTAQYNDQVKQFAEAVRANRSDDPIFQDPDQLSDEAKGLLSAYAADGQTPALIYPFVLEDKLWLVWAIEGRVIGSAEVPVSQGELSTTVQRFGELLNAPTRLDELQATGQQLYDWIIKPLSAELETNGIDHLIFVNDRVTRYIPMAALYDGEQFLIERFQVSTVLAPGVTNTSDRLGTVNQSQVLGLGLSNPVSGFNPLPAVDIELDAIVRSDESDTVGIYPGQVYLNDAFTFDALKTNVRHHRVLHLATHAAFVPGRADESFIVLGNGDRLTAGDIEDISARLDNLHLVILSACETALGGATGDGTEITGISSYFLGANDSRAETVIASLWAVNDNSTSVLMQRFYELLASSELTKAEALRQAQLSLLYDEDTETRLAATRSPGAKPTLREGFDIAVTEPGYRHPYYWGPFILIGNGL